MKKFKITIEWEIRDSRDITGGYYTGISNLVVEASCKEVALNSAIDFARNIPSSEIIATYVYKIGLLNGDYGFSTAVGLFNSVINVILLLAVNKIVSKLNDGQGI